MSGPEFRWEQRYLEEPEYEEDKEEYNPNNEPESWRDAELEWEDEE